MCDPTSIENSDNRQKQNGLGSVPCSRDQLDESLKKLSGKESSWNQMLPASKLALLEEMNSILSYEMTLDDDWGALGAWSAHTLMGAPRHTAEGQLMATIDSVVPFLQVQQALEKLIEAYKVACMTSTNKKYYDKKLQAQQQDNGQVVLPVFPLLPKDNFGPNAGLQVEWWLDSKEVTTPESVIPFDLEAFRDDKDNGVLVILGAGNQSFLTLIDALEGLFVRQRTILIKHHPLRGQGLDPICRRLFRPLYEGHYMDSCLDLQSDNTHLVYHPLVTAIHMTGGKPTHDAIVWGSTQDEQATNKQNKTPKLKAEMSSELGCITPWIMTSGVYTPKELEHHAEILLVGIHGNASANCLAPKVIVMDKNWSQREEFISLLRRKWEDLELPVAYYPGSKERWTAYRKAYNGDDATEWNGYVDTTTSIGRDFSPPLLNNGQYAKEVVVLPLLCVDIPVDLTTNEGREKARAEYAFQHEPFCPVVTLVTIQRNNDNSYLENAVTLCNDYIFGSLSCSMSVPSSLDKNSDVEKAIADLHYGTVGVNIWTGMCYTFSWGGYAPVETLDSVESGIGRVNNYLFVPHLVKSVVRAPAIWKAHLKPTREYAQMTRILKAVGAFGQTPGVVNLVSLLGAVLKIPPMAGWGAVGAVAVGVAAILVHRANMTRV